MNGQRRREEITFLNMRNSKEKFFKNLLLKSSEVAEMTPEKEEDVVDGKTAEQHRRISQQGFSALKIFGFFTLLQLICQFS